ncbi:SDR family oxidoreductase [Clostridium estertheticum]|uniref:SDR family NAD(P)-dependent oxidoreductase n=1 Tax=Clostridium estertheticum TaxID=238834 RepID=UPI001C0D9EE2|nr:SDR family oxidoreductase [Clostridium estertheticum]MBU3179193.1 SDR family oxidoreductase [Clostridium estertheticum]
MKNVCVITGGGSGMGFEAAKLSGGDHYIIISGRNIEKLQSAVDELKAEGIEAEAFACDVSDFESVTRLAERAIEVGKIDAVIHSAGISPHMGDSQKIMEINALGTINVNEVFSARMGKETCILDISSVSAYMLPDEDLYISNYELSFNDKEQFIKKMLDAVNHFPEHTHSNMAYIISKNFVIWYAKKCAALYGDKGIRVVSVSPGTIETPMGKLESKEGGNFTKLCAIKRFGYAKEVAYLIASCIDKRNGYLTGTDIPCDGGLVSGMKLTKN